jgi:hypothetical protein
MLSPLKLRGDLRPSDGAPKSLRPRDQGGLFRRLILARSAEISLAWWTPTLKVAS